MHLHAHYTLVVRDRHGRVIKRIRRRSRSYVIAFLDSLNATWSQTNRSVTDTAGTVQTIQTNMRMDLTAPATNAAYGPVVGTGTTAVAITDSKLVTPIVHGTGAGQMEYQVTAVSAPSTSGSTRSCTVQRVFINNSGASITIQECGVYGLDLQTSKYFCLVRDLVSGGLAVPAGGSATITYTIGVTA